jgi:hypothetical protein
MRKLLFVVAACLMLTGCDLLGADSDNAVVLTTPTPTVAVTEKPEKEYYSVGEKVKIKDDDGSVIGTFKLNQVEKEKINDWKNAKAVQNDVNYSYSTNVTVDFSKSSSSFASLTVNCEPQIVFNDGEVKSSTCDVGWSGFASKAELYSNHPKKTIEIGVQPEEKVRKGCILQFVLRDQNNNVLKVIKYKYKVLKKARKGAKLLSGKDVAKITSKNGAKFSVSIRNVYFENHEIVAPGEEKSINDAAETANFFDVVYRVSALTKPKNSSFVKNITTYRGKSALLSNFTLGLDTMNASSVSYNPVKNATRNIYSNDAATEYYVSSKLEVPFGYHTDIITNRQASDTDSYKPSYVRIRLEFEEEANARSEKKRMRFNGRYVVFQVKIGERKLKVLEKQY